MTDMTEIIKSMPSDNKKQKSVNGVLRDTYFFKDFIGYDHPLQMHGPLSYAETQSRNYGYLEASYNTDKYPILILFESYFVRREPVKIEEKQLGKNRSGEAFYLFHREDQRLILDKAVKLDDTFYVKEYVRIIFNEKGDINKSELARKEWEYSCAYECDNNGVLLKVVMKNETEGTRILEKGKDF